MSSINNSSTGNSNTDTEPKYVITLPSISFTHFTDTSLFSKTTGQCHSIKGTLVEMVGNVTGSESWQKSGRDEHAAGEAEYDAAQVKEYAEGTLDRVTGKKDAVVGAVTGDREQEVSGEYFHRKRMRRDTDSQCVVHLREFAARQGSGAAGIERPHAIA